MTSPSRSVTESISIDAPPDAVMRLVGDPEQLPRWAPGFARRVRRDGERCERWIVDDGERERTVRIRVHSELGLVDYLPNGSFSRVVDTERGSEMLFTSMLAADATEADREATRATIAGELATVRELVENDR